MGGIIKLPSPKAEEKCVIVIELAGPVGADQQADFVAKFDKFKQDLKRAVDAVKADVPVVGVVRKKY